MVPVKKLWAASLSGEPIDLRGLAEPALIVPESMPALDAVKRFRRRPNTAAMVVDEYGGVQGLLSLHDLVEAITGDLGETPEGTDEAVQRADGSWLLDGALPVHQVRSLLHVGPLPGEESGDFETLGGFLMASLGRIPDVGDTFDWDNRRFEIVDMDGRRIDRVLVTSEVGPA
jgi:putative hemolysin